MGNGQTQCNGQQHEEDDVDEEAEEALEQNGDYSGAKVQELRHAFINSRNGASTDDADDDAGELAIMSINALTGLNVERSVRWLADAISREYSSRALHAATL